MPFWRAYYHLVWATKNREHLITPEVELRLYPFLVAKAGELRVHVFAVNGWLEHVHLVAAVPPALAIADVVQRLKGSSAHFLNHPQQNAHFGWQRGYGVLTLGQRQLPQAEAYVRGQKEHHTRGSANPWLERDEDDAHEDDESCRLSAAQLAVRQPLATYEVADLSQVAF